MDNRIKEIKVIQEEMVAMAVDVQAINMFHQLNKNHNHKDQMEMAVETLVHKAVTNINY